MPGELCFEIRRAIRLAPVALPAAAPYPHPTEAIRDGAPEFAAARGIRHGELDVSLGRRRLVEVGGAEPDELATLAEREHLRGAPAAALVAEHGDTTVPPRPDDHVPRLEALDRTRPAAGGAPPAPFVVQRGAQAAVVVDVAGSPLGRVAMSGKGLAAALQLPFEAHDVPVGLELRERQVQEM